jgi:hypothetical protein
VALRLTYIWLLAIDPNLNITFGVFYSFSPTALKWNKLVKDEYRTLQNSAY